MVITEFEKKKRNLLIQLRFDGSAYHGWQVQKNALTVQQVLQDAMQKVFGQRPDITGCSRTDAGVHANDYCCNFRTESPMPCAVVVKALNANLPFDIAVFSCREVDATFHARYSATAKEYIYKILGSESRNPFLNKFALHYPYPLNLSAMSRAAGAFLGEHDFTSFCASGGSVADKVRTVELFEVQSEGSLVFLKVRANGYLYNMVRIMTGTLLSVSAGRIDPGDIAAIFKARDRSRAGFTVPAHGLYLNRVYYEGAV